MSRKPIYLAMLSRCGTRLGPAMTCALPLQDLAHANAAAAAEVLSEQFRRAVEFVEERKSEVPPQHYALFKVNRGHGSLPRCVFPAATVLILQPTSLPG
mmetsp:Transcript_8691/g.25009  ORF Transcript_8691/g.25009 Transcript_8691/m.25009 type:complete len:99 (+) Transcript_8691:1878-2174(+)